MHPLQIVKLVFIFQSARFEGRANFISPKKLKEWLDRGTDDTGRPVVMVDTRNACAAAGAAGPNIVKA